MGFFKDLVEETNRETAVKFSHSNAFNNDELELKMGPIVLDSRQLVFNALCFAFNNINHNRTKDGVYDYLSFDEQEDIRRLILGKNYDSKVY